MDRTRVSGTRDVGSIPAKGTCNTFYRETERVPKSLKQNPSRRYIGTDFVFG